eukprot:gene11590-13530_t
MAHASMQAVYRRAPRHDIGKKWLVTGLVTCAYGRGGRAAVYLSPSLPPSFNQEKTMPITDYASLLRSARAQEQPQRLLFTFTQAQAQPGGQGKSLMPVICADKLPDELGSFEALEEESKQMQTHWDVPPAPEDCEAPLRAMVAAIEQGRVDSLLAFDRSGDLLRFS